MRFRPCIDLHAGQVKQIVGGTFRDNEPRAIQENHVSMNNASYFARLYKEDNLKGGHVIMLGPGNVSQAMSALQTFPGGLQVGGGISPQNARSFLEAGASHVIVTSYVFHHGILDQDRLHEMIRTVGKDNLVLDLSCKEKDGEFYIVTDHWQRFTSVRLDPPTLTHLEKHCSEFLVHAADVEGRRQGIQERLVSCLGQWCALPTTYAGGAKSLDDLDRVKALGQDRIDLTIGSALDLFGGDIPYKDVVAWNRSQER